MAVGKNKEPYITEGVMSENRVSFELSQPHQHQGKDCDIGDVIELRLEQATWLTDIERGKII